MDACAGGRDVPEEEAVVGARPCEVEGGQLSERMLPETYAPNVGLWANSSLPWHQAPLVIPFC